MLQKTNKASHAKSDNYRDWPLSGKKLLIKALSLVVVLGFVVFVFIGFLVFSKKKKENLSIDIYISHMNRFDILPNIVQANSSNVRILLQRIFQGILLLLGPKKMNPPILLHKTNTDHLPSDLDYSCTYSNYTITGNLVSFL